MTPEPDALDLGPAIRTALVEAETVGGLLGKWKGEPAVFTRRPVPDDAPMPLAIVNPDVAITNADGLTSEHPIVVRDVAFYGTKGPPGTEADQTRVVEAAAFAARKLFHRQRFSLRLVGYSVISITVTGPIEAPVDDEVTVGRLVTLTAMLGRT